MKNDDDFIASQLRQEAKGSSFEQHEFKDIEEDNQAFDYNGTDSIDDYADNDAYENISTDAQSDGYSEDYETEDDETEDDDNTPIKLDIPVPEQYDAVANDVFSFCSAVTNGLFGMTDKTFNENKKNDKEKSSELNNSLIDDSNRAKPHGTNEKAKRLIVLVIIIILAAVSIIGVKRLLTIKLLF